MTRLGDTQKEEAVCLQDKRKAVGFRQQRGKPSQGDQKIPGLEQSRSPLTLGSGETAQVFFLAQLLPLWLAKWLKRPRRALRESRDGANRARNALRTHRGPLLLSLPQNTALPSHACRKPPPSPLKRCQW